MLNISRRRAVFLREAGQHQVSVRGEAGKSGDVLKGMHPRRAEVATLQEKYASKKAAVCKKVARFNKSSRLKTDICERSTADTG